ncbi:MAG: hypothetical protein ACI4TD_14240 [Phocaeicola sp.]
MMHNDSCYVTIYLISGKEFNFCMNEDMRNNILAQFKDYGEDFMTIQYIEHWTSKDVVNNFVIDKSSILGISWKENVN